MYCKKCGAYMSDQSEFCPSCGERNPHSAEIPVVTAPRRSNTLIIGVIIAVTVVIVAAICCVTWLVSGSRSSDTEDDGQSLEATQSETEELQSEEQTGETENSASTDSAENIEKTSADTSSDTTGETDTTQGDAAASTNEAAGDDAESDDTSSNVTNNYYYYGDTASSDNEYYTKSSQSGYLWPTDTQYISMSDLSGLSQDTVAAIRNEIYARHGYAFQTERWQNYFAAKSWYHRDSSCTENTINARLSSIEKANINTIVAYEESMGWR